MSSLMVNIDGVEYSEHYNYMEVGYGQSILTTTVYVDGSNTINHFNITCDSNWVEIRRIRNEITLIISKNCAIDYRIATIQFRHNVDFNTFVTLSIKQVASEYPIEIDPQFAKTVYEPYNPGDIIQAGDTYYVYNSETSEYEENIADDDIEVQEGDEFYKEVIEFIVEFNDLLDKDDNPEECVDITVTTQNGICDFGIGPVVEYAKNISDGDNTAPYIVKNDKGLKLTKIGKDILRITNYGKISLYDYNHYIITLFHRNNPRSNVKLKVIYNNATDNNQSGLSFGD